MVSMRQEAFPQTDTVAPRQRVFIGDVHGCADELEDLLELIDVYPQRHELWFVGDLVNGGPHSASVVRRAMSLGADAVLGNHDLHALACATGERQVRPRDNLAELLEAADRDVLLAWLRARPLLHTWPDIVLVHAGLHPHWRDLDAMAARPYTADEADFATRVRHCDEAGGRPAKADDLGVAPPPFAPWDHWYGGDRTVVFGHWARRGLVVQSRLRGLDTSCVYGGRLTAWIAEEDRLVSVAARRAYQST